ncbi:MAG: TlpA disulfide reductase family protein [Actinomycetota bacterium]
MSDAGDADAAGGGLTSIQIVAASVGIVIVAFIVLLATRDVQQNEASDEPIGGGVPPIAGVSYDGAEFDIDDVLTANRSLAFADREWTVINFFASWCIPCRTEHPELVRLDAEGARCPTRLVGVAVSDSADDVTAFFDELGGEWPVLVGDTSGMIVDLSVVAPPETVIVDPDGQVTAKFVGAVTYEAIDQVLSC